MLTLQNSMNYARPFINWVPLVAGIGQEPATSIATVIRNSFLNAPMTWLWNRNQTTFQTTADTQDYPEQVTDFGFLEACTLTDASGNIYTVKDIYNTAALGPCSTAERPNAISVQNTFVSSGLKNFTFRFISIPDQIYTVTLVYQKLAPLFGPFTIASVAAESGGNTAYTGTFDPYSLATGAYANIVGCTNSVNNGNFQIVTCTSTTLTVANTGGVLESPAAPTATAVNLDWFPIPDQFSDVYNQLFLSEAFTIDGDAQKAQMYRQRGVAAFLTKAEGLTETQKNAWAQQWLARDVQVATTMQKAQQGVQARGV